MDKNIGQKYGRLTVLEHVETKNYMKKYKCKCECGNTKIVYLNNLKRGLTTSCGCYHSEKVRVGIHNGRWTRLYSIWTNMKTRCYNKEVPGYENYGGRGISICEEWKNDFTNFKNWSLSNGYKSNLSIDRINNNGNYEPENCRWINQTSQNNNKRNNRMVSYNGITKTLKEWSNELNLNYKTVHTRVSRGASELEALGLTDKLIEG